MQVEIQYYQKDSLNWVTVGYVGKEDFNIMIGVNNAKKSHPNTQVRAIDKKTNQILWIG